MAQGISDGPRSAPAGADVVSCELWACKRYPNMARAFGHDAQGHRGLLRVLRGVAAVNSVEPEYVLLDRFLRMEDHQIEKLYQVGRLTVGRIKEAQTFLGQGREQNA